MNHPGWFTDEVNDNVALVIVALYVAGGPTAAYFACRWAATRLRPKAAAAPAPIAMTIDGQPIYPVVGYTAAGQPITADRVAGGFNPRTNSLAIVTLVLAFFVAPLAIPFGHVARSQIRRTGEQGAGIALAGLIVGYISTVLLIGAAVAIASAFNAANGSANSLVGVSISHCRLRNLPIY